MTRNDLVKSIKATAKECGFKCSGTVLWTAKDDLVTAVQLQASRFDSGLYVNTGVLPRAMITKPSMPGAGYWSLGLRGSDIRGPFKEWYSDLESAAAGHLRKQLPSAVAWLCDFIRSHYLDIEYVREFYKNVPDDDVPDIMRDWLRGELRKPQVYWPKAPYYKTARSK